MEADSCLKNDYRRHPFYAFNAEPIHFSFTVIRHKIYMKATICQVVMHTTDFAVFINRKILILR